MRFDIIPPIVIGRRAVDQVIVGTMKLAGYYLMDISRCGKNYHLGNERWMHFSNVQEVNDKEWNDRYYTTDLIPFDDMAAAADYIVTRYSLNGVLYAGCNKKGLRKMIPKPYRLEVRDRLLIKPR